MSESPLAQPMNSYDVDPEQGPAHSAEIGPDGLPLSVIQESDQLEPVTTLEEEDAGEEEEHSEDRKLEVRTRRFATVMNLVNSLLGAGILSVPNSFVNIGWAFSLMLLLLMAVLSLAATYMVIILSKRTGTKGLSELAAHILGGWGANFLAVLNLLFLVTALIAYLILGSDSVISWFALAGIDMTPTFKRALLVFIYGLLPGGLSIPRNISFLQYVSTATFCCIFFFFVVMIYKAIVMVGDNGVAPGVVAFKMDMSVFSSMSIVSLSFALPAVVLPAIKMYNPLTRKRKIVTNAAILLCFILVAIPGICGYLCFGEKTEGNVLKSFKDDDYLILVVRICFFIVVTCAYPMVAQSIMSAWSQVIYQDDNPIGLPTKKRAVVLLITNMIPLVLAMFLPEAKPALGVSGALGGCLVDFVFPSLIWLKSTKLPYSDWRNVLAAMLGIFGAVAAVISTYQAVLDAINSFK